MESLVRTSCLVPGYWEDCHHRGVNETGEWSLSYVPRVWSPGTGKTVTIVESMKQVIGVSRPYLVFGPPGTGKTVTIVESMKQVSEVSRPYLVFGPPGTGKTVTIVESMKQVNHRFGRINLFNKSVLMYLSFLDSCAWNGQLVS